MRDLMDGRFADLHIHTFYSDGTDSPQEVVRLASEKGLTAISITDHDTVDGFQEAFQEGQQRNVEVIAGVELSSEYGQKDIHILGYFFDTTSQSPLIKSLYSIRAERVERMKKMLNRLEELGIKDLSYQEVSDKLKSDAVGRLHLAQLLVEKQVVPTLDMAFREYLAEGGKAYFPKFKQTPFDAIKLIKDSGGVAVMAHPVVTQKDEMIPSMVRAGLDGIEAWYPHSLPQATEFYINLAKKHRLIVTGGSDAHGKGKTNTYIGKAYVDYAAVEEMRARCGK